VEVLVRHARAIAKILVSFLCERSHCARDLVIG
jgi:hypothetical protein